MRPSLLLLASVSILLCGCGRVSDRVAQFAENTRTATEQMAFASLQADVERERRIDPDIGEARNRPALTLVERYETREGPDGLFVYDTQTHSVARIGSQPQQGLNMQQASKAVDALAAADAKGLEH